MLLRKWKVSDGKKYDGEKPQMYLLPPKSMLEVSRVLTFGARKYDPENWRKLENLQNRYSSAALRHIFAHIDGSKLDDDSGLSHLAHAICCLLFKLEIELENGSKEDKKERSREFDGREYSTSYRLAPAHFYGSEAYNQKTGLRNTEYKLQYNPPRYDSIGISGTTGIRTEKKKSKSGESSKPE